MLPSTPTKFRPSNIFSAEAAQMEDDAEYDRLSRAPTPVLQTLLLDSVPENDTPPLTPLSDTSTEDASTEEPTIEEVPMIEYEDISVDGEESLNSDMYTSDETGAETEATTDSDEEYESERMANVKETTDKILYFWFLFWFLSVVGGGIAFCLYNRYESTEPVKTNVALKLVARENWDWDTMTSLMLNSAAYRANRVVLVHTESLACESLKDCPKALNDYKRKQSMIKFNFMIASDGYVYEGLGWLKRSPLFSEKPTLVVAFIGNYADKSPSPNQLAQLEALLKQSVELEYLNETYALNVRKLITLPSKLFAFMPDFKNWDKNNSDTDEVYTKVAEGPFKNLNH